MNKSKIAIIILCALLCLSFSATGFLISANIKNQSVLQSAGADKKVLAFRTMFTQNVLLSDKPIDFDTRLSLETAVRALNDPEIFGQWQAFINSQTQDDATAQAKKLLELLIQKTAQ